MIKPQDLRIGNYLYGVITPRIVESINKDYYTDTYGNSTLIRDSKPIPLTEEWCDKLNIVRIAMNGFRHKENGFDISCSYELKYVHQAQNLYYASTMNELI